HKTALACFGFVLTAFSVTHATLSFFNVAQHAAWGDAINYYAHNVAFPLLFGLLFVSSIAIYLTHFQQKVKQEQARAMIEIETNRVRQIAESVRMRAEAALERDKLAHLEEQMRIEGEYVGKLKAYVRLKQEEIEIVKGISDPALREQVARELGLDPDDVEAFPR